MTSSSVIADASNRCLAETTFDRNVVVVAGAGTGKTTLLVNRLVHVLVREPNPVPITAIVALTFTNKAASEMKCRLRGRLLALSMPEREGMEEPGAVRLADLRDRYRLSSEEITRRTQRALDDLEKAQIGTLHSFAAHLLRLHPIESAVDPHFQEDDGLRFEEHFAAQWDTWIEVELGSGGSNHARWRRLLSVAELAQLRELAKALCNELVPLDALGPRQDRTLSPPIRDWISSKRDRSAALLAVYDRGKRRKVETSLTTALGLFDLVLKDGFDGLHGCDTAACEALLKDLGDCPSGWNKPDFSECSSLVRVARQLLMIDGTVIDEVLTLLHPFLERVRAGFAAQGWMTFDGLLSRGRALLRDNPQIRERVKAIYQAILVDEFQDTDPSQYEIILYLAEEQGRCESHWRDLALTPGKLFIVGDPKQSVYAFRRADLEAFDQVVGKIRADGGMVCELTTNFRSHQTVLDVVNECFDRLFIPKENLQPHNVPLAARPGRTAGMVTPGVALRLVKTNDDEAFDAATATRVEAELLAVWLKEEMLGGETLIDADGRRGPLRPGHVALLFRKLTYAQEYLEALRRHGIDYVTDGEKHFYRRQEIVDLINLLRAVDDPHDAIALVGVLRSPLGGLTDREVYDLRSLGGFDYRFPEHLAAWQSERAPTIRHLYERLRELHQTAPIRSLPEVLDLLFMRLPVLELAGATLHGEQAVANLMKVRQMAVEVADRPNLLLTGFVALMTARLAEQPEEAEAALAEESLDAVRVLTIHKAKGLEFPVVILPGLHQGVADGRDDRMVSHDWSGNLYGIRLGDRWSPEAVLISEKTRAKEAAERRRLLYVGMTRAKERLILSGGLTDRLARGGFLRLLEEAADAELGVADQPPVQIGTATVTQTVLRASEQMIRSRYPGRSSLRTTPDWTELLRRWEQRESIRQFAATAPLRLTPTLLMKQQTTRRKTRRGNVQAGLGESLEEGRARLIGILAHRVLEEWDFSEDPTLLPSKVHTLVLPAIPVHEFEQLEEVKSEVKGILEVFAKSEAYATLRSATILGREVPFAIPWVLDHSDVVPRTSKLVTSTCVMEGVMDLVYRLDGRLWVADYKTDLIDPSEAPARAADYHVQARIYRAAVTAALGTTVGCQFLFLRTGQAVPMTT